jgi:hypothetical protein
MNEKLILQAALVIVTMGAYYLTILKERITRNNELEIIRI